MVNKAALVAVGVAGLGLAGLAIAAKRKGAASASQIGGVSMIEATGTGGYTASSGALGVQSGALKGVPNWTAFDAIFRAEGAKYGVDPLLLKAIALQESTLNPSATNTSNPADPSYGLMQISCMPDGNGGCLPNEFNLSDWPPSSAGALLSPRESIHYGAEIMAQNLAATGGNVAQAAAMYNSGTTYDPAYVAGVSHYLVLMGGSPL